MKFVQHRQPWKPGVQHREHDSEGLVVKLPNGETMTAYTPLVMFPEYAADEMEFMQAMERFKKQNRRPFPTWREVLGVMKALGYRRTESQRDGSPLQPAGPTG